MKRFHQAAAAVALGVAFATPAMAQDDGASQTTAGTANIETRAAGDNDRDMGWIGLLGLAGLLGLRGRKHDHHVERRTEYRPDTRNPTAGTR